MPLRTRRRSILFHENELYIGQHDRFGDGRMVMMLKRSISDSKRVVLIVGAVIVLALFCLVVIAGVGWVVFRSEETPELTAEPFTIDYCGAELTDLCVMSFSQDVFGNTMVNLFVPFREYPTFDLNIIRQSGESRFECEWEKKVPTNVHCTGTTISLGEGFELQVISVKDESLIAYGPFTLTAYLITTQTADGEPVASDTPAPAPTEEASPTPTETPEEDLFTPTENPEELTETATEEPELIVETATP